jgi:hypothetical protein
VRKVLLVVAVFFGSLLSGQPALADSTPLGGITLFRTDVTVIADGSLEVNELIVVNNASSYYPHGFRRNLPISAEDRWDPRYVGEYKSDNGIRVNILGVTEDRKPVSYKQGSGYGYPQLLIGEQGVPLDSGKHHFVIHYMVDFAMKLAGSRDTFYWNAIGHGHEDPIEEEILSVRLPSGVPEKSIEIEPRVGGRGVSRPRQSETALVRLDHGNGPIVYRATKVGPRQSLSLAITWPSGYVRTTKLDSLRRDMWLLGAPAALFLYYLIAWFWIGREPKPGNVITRYEPPDGMSPAAARFLYSGTTDGRSFAAVIAQLAVRGCIRVESVGGKYKLSRLMSDRATDESLAPEERTILGLLFEDAPVIELSGSMDQTNSAQNSRYIANIHQDLASQLGGKFLTRHAGITALGVLATFAMALPLALTAHGRDATGAFFFTVWVLFCGLMLGMMIELSFTPAWKSAMKTRTGWIKMLPGFAAIAVFGGAIVLMLKNLAVGVSLSFSLMVVAFLLVNLGWGPMLKRRSALGREMLDQVAGFRQFLAKVEQDKLNRLNPSENGPQDLDKLLPYAIALEVTEAWGDRLSQSFFATTVFVE